MMLRRFRGGESDPIESSSVGNERPGAEVERPAVSVVVVTYNAMPYVERCLDSVRRHELVVVDHGSTDGTAAFVRERFPDARVVEQANRGLAAGWNRGMREASGHWFLILNADAWVLDDGLERLVAFAQAHPRAAVVGPRLLNLDGTLQRSVRGFPTPWRIATEYLFLRKLAPRTAALNAYYAARFDHRRARPAEWLYGACMLVRRSAVDEVGELDEDFFLFSEETDWQRRFRDAGWEIWFTPDAEVVHAEGASHGGRFYHENLRGLLRYLAKHEGLPAAERARLVLAVALVFRARIFRGERGRMYAEAARLVRSGTARELLARRP
jgi:N-acetylglucosaminyl-diphospho-decaprenol L-rhamnosyltransferase